MGSAMFSMNSGTCPNTEQTRPEYLKKPMSRMSTVQDTATHSFFLPRVPAPATRSAQNQEVSAMNISSRTYFGSPQA